MAIEALSQLRLRRSTTTQAVITHYVLPLEGFWTNPLAKVGEAPILPLTGYKACSYLPQAVMYELAKLSVICLKSFSVLSSHRSCPGELTL